MPSSSSSSTSSSSSSSYTSQSSSTESSTVDSGIHTVSQDYWSTTQILARNAARTPVSAPPNSSTAFEPKRAFTPYISLGPVIGMVTDTTARILIETSQTCTVKCFLTDKYGVQHGMVKRVPRETPVVFFFEELRANTVYKVTFDMPCPGLVKSSFKTLPSGWSVAKNPARVAVVSCNNFQTNRDAIPQNLDLWKSLYSQCKRQEVDYIFHLGNIAFVDSDEYTDTSRGRQFTGKECAYQEALNVCDGLDGEQLVDAEKRVCDIFRNVYRDTWNVPTTRHVLANAPNLMILDDHEISHKLGDDDSNDRQTIPAFLQFCAYRVYNEYCRALFEDYTPPKQGGSLSGAMKIGQAYHLHAFGDLGFLFLDTRAQRAIHKDWNSDDSTTVLGAKQWSDLEYALSDGGYLHDCRVLLVCSAQPMAQLGEPGYFTTQGSLRQLAGTWNVPQALDEASMLLSRLFDWKATRPGKREVVLLAGSNADGGVTELVDLRMKAQNNIRCERMRQITSGPIAHKAKKSWPSLASAGSGIKWLGPDHQFKHIDVVSGGCNFALVDIERQRDGGEVLIRSQHVVAGSKAVAAKAQLDSTVRASGWWAKRPASTV